MTSFDLEREFNAFYGGRSTQTDRTTTSTITSNTDRAVASSSAEDVQDLVVLERAEAKQPVEKAPEDVREEVVGDRAVVHASVAVPSYDSRDPLALEQSEAPEEPEESEPEVVDVRTTRSRARSASRPSRSSSFGGAIISRGHDEVGTSRPPVSPRPDGRPNDGAGPDRPSFLALAAAAASLFGPGLRQALASNSGRDSSEGTSSLASEAAAIGRRLVGSRALDGSAKRRLSVGDDDVEQESPAKKPNVDRRNEPPNLCVSLNHGGQFSVTVSDSEHSQSLGYIEAAQRLAIVRDAWNDVIGVPFVHGVSNAINRKYSLLNHAGSVAGEMNISIFIKPKK